MNDLPPYTLVPDDSDENILVARMTFAADCVFFSGHFDGLALLPAVAQLYVAEQIAQTHWGTLGDFSDLKQVKFREPIFPDTTVTLTLQRDPQQRRLHFCYASDTGLKSSGQLHYGNSHASA